MSAVELKRFCYLVHAAEVVGILQKIVKSISSFKRLLSEQNALSGETGSFLETMFVRPYLEFILSFFRRRLLIFFLLQKFSSFYRL